MKISKEKLSDLVYKRLDRSIPKMVIYDVITVMFDYFANELFNNRAVSIKNFGTWSPFMFHEHEGINVATGVKQIVQSFRTVKFVPHTVFRKLLSISKERFEKSKDHEGL